MARIGSMINPKSDEDQYPPRVNDTRVARSFA
jgi:hypothetical protein